MTIRLAAAAALAVTFLAAAPASAAEPIAPMQAVVADVGDKQLVAYYMPAAGRCALTMMLDESADSRERGGMPVTAAARVSVELRAGETASVDAANGERVAFTCGPDAGRMAVERRVAQTVASR